MLELINKMKVRDERGFTLVELLIVIAIIAILAAIAIPQFAAYRQRGVRASMQADARNLATSLEAFFADNQSYTTFTIGAGSAITAPVSAKASAGNSITVTGSTSTYTISAINSNGGSSSTQYTIDNTGATAWH